METTMKKAKTTEDEVTQLLAAALAHIAKWTPKIDEQAAHKLAAIENLLAACPDLGPRLINMRLNLRERLGLNTAIEVVGMLEPKGVPAPAKTVRAEQSFGACRTLGEFVRETATHFSYKDAQTGKIKTAKKNAKNKHARMAAPRPHVDPCSSCTENWNPNACMHGNAGFCEQCASM